MKKISNQSFDAERALYGERDITVTDCTFDGPADGESAFKETKNVTAEGCFFNLRYPFWHVDRLRIDNCELTSLCRAALWYSHDIEIEDSRLHGIKALRECSRVALSGCDIISPEFGWLSKNVRMENCTAESEYFMLRGEKLHFDGVNFKGKYSFQYITDSLFENCVFDTKDAFWHSKNVTVKNCVVKGEYLAWYSQNLTLINCRISGTQPLCYCHGLRLIDCEMTDADLCFEKSQVKASLTAPVISIKNPAAGEIRLPSGCEIIRDDPHSRGKIIIANR